MVSNKKFNNNGCKATHVKSVHSNSAYQSDILGDAGGTPGSGVIRPNDPFPDFFELLSTSPARI
jgi:hypothetical protein